MKQYDIWWANLPEPAGRRPVLLMSRTPAYEYLSRVVVVEVTSTVRGISPKKFSKARERALQSAA